MFKNTTIKTVSLLLVVLTLVSGSAMSVLTFRAYYNARLSQQHWADLRLTSDAEARAVASVIRALGYGGLIHDFKNYVLRLDPAVASRAQHEIGALSEMIARLSLVEDSASARAALTILNDAILFYSARLETVRDMARAGAGASEIDAAVRYDDVPAIDALATLVNHLNRSGPPGRSTGQRVKLLAELHRRMGYGGAIYMFKNYVLRGDETWRDQFERSAAGVRDTLGQYRALDLTPTETVALEQIEDMLVAYQSRLDLVRAGVARGDPPERIDARVKYDDTLAIAAFGDLDRALTQRIQATARVLDNELDRTRQLWILAFWGTIAVSGALALAIYSVLSSLVVTPSRRIADGLVRLADGETDVDLSDLVGPSEIGEVARAAAVFRDRSIELVGLREAMLSDSLAQTGSILDGAMCAILSIDAQGRIETANRAALDLFGASEDALIGRDLDAFLDLPAPRTGEPSVEAFLHRAQNSKQDSGCVTVQRISGEAFPAKLSIGKVQMHNRVSYTAIVTDLTEKLKVDRLKNEFVSTVSHELRTPLTSIKGSLGLMKSSILGELSEKGQAMVDIAYNNCDRLVRLINDILDIEKIEAGKMDFRFETLDVGAQITRAVEICAGFASERSVRLDAPDIPERFMIRADADRLQQALTNLLSNAIKFTPEGDSVTLSARRHGERVRLSVLDRGPGIPAEDRARIFDKFAQADSSDMRSGGGTGLGLSIARLIARAHSGDIGFSTELGEGSVFWIDLPLLAELPADPQRPRRGRVLVCEDEADVARLLHAMVRELGLEAEVCATMDDACDRIALGGIDLVTVDYGMVTPGTLHRLDAWRGADGARLPVLVITGRDVSARQRAAFAETVAVADWLSKPIQTARLRNGLRRMVDRQRGTLPRLLHIDPTPEHVEILHNVTSGFAETYGATSFGALQRLLAEGRAYDLVVLDPSLPMPQGEDLFNQIAAHVPIAPTILIYSAEEPPVDIRAHADGVLVKSRTSNADLRLRIEQLLAREAAA